ncbi:unnamed protein product [Tetraodon nigroviridis]|uniref:Chromosome 15 SCAF14542, whole genome shotgun sequence n=1 Tax=Tetraodon nigroviridis TaxID=99883 RepID=Q4SNR9_TETNG|nr:unnamed protein product [Tetraodon nigroviridis]
MASFWQAVLLWALGVAVLVQADMKLGCEPGYITLVWTENSAQVDMSLFRLGTCYPTSVSPREVVFRVDVNDCNFSRMVTGNVMVYSNELVYADPHQSQLMPISHPVICEYPRPKDWYPRVYDPVFDTFGQADLVFHMGVMNDDFSGPAESTTFTLGSLIPIMASVEQHSHQPLLLLLEECVATPTPDLWFDGNAYDIVTNKGCLVDSKVSRSRFEPREKSSEIQLLLQAFKFGLGEQVFIHCMLVAADPNGLDSTKKACHYQQHGWQLLDNPAYSSLCACCDSGCSSRKTRSVATGDRVGTQGSRGAPDDH